ncbi:hypothetical protein BDI4_280045 [Burkholderia diffusa]|nr:hypothetical protein BDI4_280045 [Burkholderia diffusa]
MSTLTKLSSMTLMSPKVADKPS